jgi:hypothetical protein
MAEVIGVVAASLEIAKLVSEVKQFFSSIRHAPQSLQQLLGELEELQEVLQTHKEQEAALSVYVLPDVVERSRLQSEKAVQGLKPLCDELLKGIKRSGLRGSVKAALKEETLQRARQVIDRSKLNFIMAQATLWK